MKRVVKGTVGPVAGLALGLSLLSPATLWELDWGLLASEPWRLVTGHLVHWSTEHLVWDLAVFLGLGVACELRSRRRTALALALAVVGIGWGARLWTPGLDVYRGLSGLDAALFTLLAARCLRGPSRAIRLAGAPGRIPRWAGRWRREARCFSRSSAPRRAWSSSPPLTSWGAWRAWSPGGARKNSLSPFRPILRTTP